jgi:hypothetical protein
LRTLRTNCWFRCNGSCIPPDCWGKPQPRCRPACSSVASECPIPRNSSRKIPGKPANGRTVITRPVYSPN